MNAQIFWLLLVIIDLCYVAYMHAKPHKDYSYWAELGNNVILALILWWGGFWDCLIK